MFTRTRAGFVCSLHATPAGERDCIETLPVVWFAFGSRVGNALVRDIYRYEETETNAPLVGMDGDVQIDRLVLDNISQTCRPGLNPPLIDNKATVKKLIASNIQE